MKIHYVLFALCCLMPLSAKSQITTGADSSTRVKSWMFPLILEDLVKKDLAEKTVGNQAREIALMKFRHSADSTIIAGMRTDNRRQARRIESLIDSSARGWQMADHWQARFKKANRERWGWRIGAAGAVYLKLKPL